MQQGSPESGGDQNCAFLAHTITNVYRHMSGLSNPTYEALRREGSPYGKKEEDATESFELEKRLALERQIEEQLADTENALAKIAAGKYGSCESCSKPIEIARLKVLPQARTCMNCKGHHKGFSYSRIPIS